MHDQDHRYARLRYTASGALAALAAVGAIAGATALAAKPGAKPHSHAAAVNGSATKSPAPGSSSLKTPPQGKQRSPQAPEPYNPDNPFVLAIHRLVSNGTISATDGQAVDREILAGYIDPQTLASSGLTQAQVQAVEQALTSTKLAMASAQPGGRLAKPEAPGDGAQAKRARAGAR